MHERLDYLKYKLSLMRQWDWWVVEFHWYVLRHQDADRTTVDVGPVGKGGAPMAHIECECGDIRDVEI